MQGLELPLRRDYVVRVLVPCFKESLAMIQRTVLAARRADRPPGTKIFIYICDDGGDPRKRMWVKRLRDPEVLYVSGRDKGGHKDLNGKSANLNHCLRLLYPDVQDPTDENEQLKIPVNELMCLFDADQTCSRGFFQARRSARVALVTLVAFVQRDCEACMSAATCTTAAHHFGSIACCRMQLGLSPSWQACICLGWYSCR